MALSYLHKNYITKVASEEEKKWSQRRLKSTQELEQQAYEGFVLSGCMGDWLCMRSHIEVGFLKFLLF